jgi:nitrite reductase/ring-hydroxylating ferredoxin subunit
MSTRYVVAPVSELPDGGRLIVNVAGRSIGVFRVGDDYYALRNRCPHAGGELCRGRVVGRLESERPGDYVHDLSRPLVACPWHGWEFDLATGQSYVDPARLRVRAYPVAVEDDHVVLTLGSGRAD